MRCEICGTRPAVRVATQIVEGQKRLLYRCDACAEEVDGKTGRSRLERPCERCGEREGCVKLTRLWEHSRTVVYLCEVCANMR